MERVLGLNLLSPAQITRHRKGAKKTYKVASNQAKIWRLNHLWNRQQGEPLPCPPPPPSVNDSYSACAVVYSFPAVKGCPLKVPFVHRLHFVIQIAPFFSKWLEVTGCPWVLRGGEKGRNPFSAQGRSPPLPSKWIPLHCTSPISSLPFQKPYIYIYI